MHPWHAIFALVVRALATPTVTLDTAVTAAWACERSDVSRIDVGQRCSSDTTGARSTIGNRELAPTLPVELDPRLVGGHRAPVGFGNVADSRDRSSLDTNPPLRRPRAIEYSDAYYTRLKIHQIGAYAMIPLFVGEYILGQKLLNSTNRSGSLKTAHGVVAAGVGIVFASNTVTGAWNFWEARKDPNGKARRTIHSVLMLASDAGFLWTAAAAGGAKRSTTQAMKHRNLAIASISLSAIGSGMMWLWRR